MFCGCDFFQKWHFSLQKYKEKRKNENKWEAKGKYFIIFLHYYKIVTEELENIVKHLHPSPCFFHLGRILLPFCKNTKNSAKMKMNKSDEKIAGTKNPAIIRHRRKTSVFSSADSRWVLRTYRRQKAASGNQHRRRKAVHCSQWTKV